MSQLDDSPLAPLPVTYSAELKDHTRAISAMAIDSSGSRLITGSYDYSLKFWDFNGMDRSHHSFRSIKPWDGYQIKDIKYWGKGNRFLVVSGATGAKMYDRDGFCLAEYHKGDPYIRDMRKTTGHIAGITCCQWHPHEKNLFLTASLDSTIRIWDADVYRYNRHVIPAKGGSGNRMSASVTAAAFSHDGKLIFGARLDGNLSAWDWRNPFLKAKLDIVKAHEPQTETSRIAVASDNFTIATRGGDGTMKIWDTRKFTVPLNAVSGLANKFQETDVVFSPDERYLVTGTSVMKGDDKGEVLFYDRKTFELKKSLSVSGSAIRIVWHPVLNQVLVGSSEGVGTIFYDPELSTKGALLSVTKESKVKAKNEYSNVDGIYLPFALPMFQEGDDFNNERAAKQRDKIQSHRPEPPKITMYGPGRHGKIGSGDTQTMLSILGKNEIRDEDPRVALLKYAEIAEKDPRFVAPVYKKTQPKTLFDYTPDEMEEQRDIKRRK